MRAGCAPETRAGCRCRQRTAHAPPGTGAEAVTFRSRPPACSWLALIVVMNLEQHAAAGRFERTVMDARWSARIGRRLETLTALALRIIADDQVAGEQINLLPMVVHERRRGVDAGREAQQPRAAAHLARLVEIAGENLLLDAGRIARRRDPALRHVDRKKFQMRLVHRHDGS